MKKRYKVMGDTKNTFLSIELDLVIEDDTIGKEINVLGGNFKITQNGPILVLAEPDWVLTLQDITPEEEKVVPKLKINDTLEIFFEPKTIEVSIDCTYEELYYFLKDEWKLLSTLKNVGEFPFEYSNRLKLFTFKDDWGFAEGSFKYLLNGSYAQINSQGRNK